MSKVKIDLNNPRFQKDLFDLEKNEQTALIKTLKKITQLTWIELYSDKGLKWEAVLSKKTEDGERFYSFRFSQKYRAAALRNGEYLHVVSLHPDHDSAYK